MRPNQYAEQHRESVRRRLSALRWRVARRLVGPFIAIPEEDGVWVVMRVDGGTGTIIVRAAKFRLHQSTKLRPYTYGTGWDTDFESFRSNTCTRFVGTVEH